MKSVLFICPFDNIYPIMNGGMQRCFNVLHQLAKHFDVTAIIHQDKNDFLKAAEEYPAITSVKILSTKDVVTKDAFSMLPLKLQKAFRYRWYKKQWKGPADGNFLLYYPLLTQLLQTQKFNVVILENLASLNAVSVIRKYDRKVKIMYDAHNVDTNLAKAALAKKEIKPGRLQNIYNAESNLHKLVDAIFTCSQNDKDEFVKLNEKKLRAVVVPNGVNIPCKLYDDGVKQDIPQYVIFCGSLWSLPNAEGLYWFCKKVWPVVISQKPGLKLLVVGIGELAQKYAGIINMPSLEFTGAVDDVKPWYNKAAVAIAPLLTGSGTRLKILEAMAMGVPVISTTIGAEGIDYTDGYDILIADNENDFAKTLIALLENKNRKINQADAAQQLVSAKYDWNVIGDKMSSFLKNY